MKTAITERFNLVGLLIYFTVSLTLIGCEKFEFGYTKIGDLLKNPSQYDGKEVKIKGEVVNIIKLPLLKSKLYMVKDNTGEILVITDSSTPGMGIKVKVKGMLDTITIIGDKSIGLHLKESKRWAVSDILCK